jgi:hypothetical protein
MIILMENQTTCHKVYLNMKNVVIFAGCKWWFALYFICGNYRFADICKYLR